MLKNTQWSNFWKSKKVQFEEFIFTPLCIYLCGSIIQIANGCESSLNKDFIFALGDNRRGVIYLNTWKLFPIFTDISIHHVVSNSVN